MPPSRRRRAPSGAREESHSQRRSAPSGERRERPSEEASSSEGDSPDHYSYEEMVDHLRKVRSTSGEQGLKSKKKRRRRSHQPIREKRRQRFMVMVASLLIVLPILTFVGGSFLFSFMAYKGERFRKEMSVSVSEHLGFQGEFEDTFNVHRLTIKNRKFSAVGSENSVLAAIELSNLEARLRASSYFSDVWRIPHLVADRAMLHLRPLPPGQNQSAEAAAPVFEETLKILAAGLGFSGVPDSYKAESISCRHLSANFGANLDLVHRLEGLHVTMNRTQSGFFINADRGTVQYFYWPEFEVDAADLSLDGDGKLTIHRATLITQSEGNEEEGVCSLSGEIHLGANPSIDLSIEVSNIKLDHMVNQRTWGNRVLGLLSGTFSIKGDLSMDSLPTISGSIQIPGLSVKELPILTALSVRCGIAQLKRIEFDLFEAQIEQKGNSIRVFDIYGSQSSIAALTGQFTVHPNHNIDGSFEIGLPDSTLEEMGKDNENGRPAFFKPKADDTKYGWAAFDVTGNLESPLDNLDRQFEAYLTGSGSYNPREYRRTTTFQRPQPLHEGPKEIHQQRLEGLFGQYVDEGLAPRIGND